MSHTNLDLNWIFGSSEDDNMTGTKGSNTSDVFIGFGGDDKFVGFVEALEDVGRHLGRTQAAYETAHKRLSSGRGNLVNQAAALHKLGVKNKKELDKKLAESAAESDPSGEQLEILD